MPELVAPTSAVRESFLRAVAEFRAESGEHAAGTQVFPDENWSDQTLAAPDGFAAYVERLAQAALEDCAGRPASHVPATTLWYVDGAAYLGRLSIRHRLTPFLLDVGGHIGYAVRPSQRRRGHATAMLPAALPYAYGLGIDPALLTCDAGNLASRKVIESAGGVFEDRRGEKLRFWVPTSSVAAKTE